MFVDIVKECVDANVFGSGVRQAKIGIDFKVLTCLRILGRNFVCDSVVEILNTGVATVNNIFKDFVANYSAAYYDKYVYVPEGAELDKVEKVYRYMEFLPGCVGSMDVTHTYVSTMPIPATNTDVPEDDEINFFANSNHTIQLSSKGQCPQINSNSQW